MDVGDRAPRVDERRAVHVTLHASAPAGAEQERENDEADEKGPHPTRDRPECCHDRIPFVTDTVGESRQARRFRACRSC